jgi:PhoD related phosphatase
MLLRESKGGRGGLRATRDIATGAAPARLPSTRKSKIPVPVPAAKASPRGLEDAGLVRNLSTTQRDRIQHSTVVDTKKPDVRRLSGEGRRGFDYEEQDYHPPKNPARSEAPPARPQELRIPSIRHKPDRDSLSSDRRQSSQGQSRNVSQEPQYEVPQGRRRSQDYARDLRSGEPHPEELRSNRDPGHSGSMRQTSAPVPVGQGVPSNITRAVSMQGQKPPPQFTEDREPVNAAPAMKNANSSHKAALTAGALGGAVALAEVGRSNSRKLQKPRPAGYDSKASQPGFEDSGMDGVTPAAKQQLSPSQMYQNSGRREPNTEPYQRGIPRQTNVRMNPSQSQKDSAGVGARESPQTPENVAVGSVTDSSPENQPRRPRQQSVSFTRPFDARPKDEWKEAGVAKLTLADMSFDAGASNSKDQAWWEQNGKQKRMSTSRSSEAAPDRIDDKRAKFDPPLYLQCGPLLRYTGIKSSKGTNDDPSTQSNGYVISKGPGETWRGSVMIVTKDSQSNYKEGPVLRLFSRPKRLLPPPPSQIEGEELAPEYIDPIAGLTKLARNGQAIYVRPVDHLPEERDLSKTENDDGLFEGSPSPLDTNEGNAPSAASTNKRTLDQDGESLGRYQEVRGARLYADPVRDVTFWRFNLEVELNDTEQHIAYRINRGPAQGFWVPGRGHSMNIMFHSCNGFSMSVNPDLFSGPDPMWRDVLNNHEFRPFHVMIGGGDQIYNDRVVVETQHFGEWTRIKNPHQKLHKPFSPEMREELEDFYLRHYSNWFSQGLFSMANAQIPMVNMWDDHDIIDGFGSYPDHAMRNEVFKGLGGIAYKYYLLFQHQSVPAETTADEPSWIMGVHPGPYIDQASRSIFMNFGSSIAFLGLDCRTERRRDEIIALDTYDLVFERLRKDIVEGETKHLIVLLGVPIAYPRLVWLENVLTSRAMDPFKALSRAGFLKGGLMNKFDGGVEILDDLDDHWTASNHKDERNIFIKDLQDLAAEKSCRITILGGDVHLAAIGQFYSQPKLRIPKDKDHRYMPNVISSAIVNTAPPEMMADILNKRNKVHHLDKYTEEDMIPMFTHDVDGKRRNNKTLLPRRNWCSIREYNPGTTPPPTPSESGSESEMDKEPEQNRLPQRRFSFTREDINPRNLFRRLSSRDAPPSSYRDTMESNRNTPQRSASFDGERLQQGENGYFGPSSTNTVPQRTSSSSSHPVNIRGSSDTALQGPQTRPSFHRRPTNLSEKAAKKGNVMAIDKEGNEFDVNNDVNLEGGLDIVLNCEINQKDPAGITTPYRLLVPALWYDGSSDREKLDDPEGVKGLQRRPTLLGRLGLASQRNRKLANDQGQGNSETASHSGSEEEHDQPPKRRFGLFNSFRRRKHDDYSDDDYTDEDEEHRSGQASYPQSNGQSGPTDHREAALLPGQQNGATQQAAEGVRPISQEGPVQDQRDLPASGYNNRGQTVPIQAPSNGRHMYIAGPPLAQQPSQQQSAHHRTTSSPFQQDMQNVQQHYGQRRQQSSNPPPPQQDIPQRRLSKQERLLGINPDDGNFPQPGQVPLRGNGIIGRGISGSPQAPQAPQQQHQHQHQRRWGLRQSSAPTPPRGYDGIEAYSAPKARRRWSLSRGRKWIGDGRIEGVD